MVVGGLLLAACSGGDDLSADEQAIADEWADELIREASEDSGDVSLPSDEALCATEAVVAEFGAEKSAGYLAEDLALAGTDEDVIYPEADASVIAKATNECVDWDPLLRSTFEGSGLTGEQVDCVTSVFVDNAEELQFRELAGLDSDDVIDLDQLEIDCNIDS